MGNKQFQYYLSGDITFQVYVPDGQPFSSEARRMHQQPGGSQWSFVGAGSPCEHPQTNQHEDWSECHGDNTILSLACFLIKKFIVVQKYLEFRRRIQCRTQKSLEY